MNQLTKEKAEGVEQQQRDDSKRTESTGGSAANQGSEKRKVDGGEGRAAKPRP